MIHPRAHKWIESIIYSARSLSRFTQRSPIMVDAWIRYGVEGPEPQDLLLMANFRETSGTGLAEALRARIGGGLPAEDAEDAWFEARLASTQTAVAARLSFRDLLRAALPLSPWWHRYLLPMRNGAKDEPSRFFESVDRFAPLKTSLRAAIEGGEPDGAEVRVTDDFVWLAVVVGRLALLHSQFPRGLLDMNEDEFRALRLDPSTDLLLDAFFEVFQGMQKPTDAEPLWSVHRNRRAEMAIRESTATVKADAARQLFDVRGRGIRWAVLDSGIDATHIAFRSRDTRPAHGEGAGPARPWRLSPTNTRIVATYDFTRIRALMALPLHRVAALDRHAGEPVRLPDKLAETLGAEFRAKIEGDPAYRAALLQALRRTQGQFRETLDHKAALVPDGRPIDWSVWAPVLSVPHGDGYRKPYHKHGTHVAGILGADWQAEDRDDDVVVAELGLSRRLVDRQGVCPEIELYDIRVLGAQGSADEFSVLAALQFIRYLNTCQDHMVIHGVNLSLSLLHEVSNYACGSTPVCVECEHLVRSGTMVVAAAGNYGRAQYMMIEGTVDDGYRTVSITDPGNAPSVITVGATHRSEPHTYGVSYFSSRGPTGDGRPKPDIIAPGEKVTSTVPDDGEESMDGTSMAAPHVSGAAALLLCRYPEFIGKPNEVKRILCETATDLDRDRNFQGAGLLDILRALQSI